MRIYKAPASRTAIVILTVLALVSTIFISSNPHFLKRWLTVKADANPQVLPLSQNWTTTTLITANDNWSGVAGIEGYLGQDITTTTGVDPQTLLTTSAIANDLDVIANQNNPNTNATGGVGEFDGIANPTIALQGSGTADAPYVMLYLNTTGQSGITVSYNLRDIDGSTDNAVQPVALQYRVGNTGNFTNIPTAFVADATTGPSLATLVTPVSAMLPAACNNQPVVQVRVITSNAVGNDEWVGVDDIVVCAATLVTNGNDSGAGSLRQAILDVCAGGTIMFSGVSTVTLTTAELAVNKSLTINGGTGVTITRSSASNFRIFNVQSGNTVAMNNLTVTNGNNPTQAGGIQNSGTLTLTDCTISGNTSGQSGGVQNDSVLTMNRCTISNNSCTAGFAGGLGIFGPTTTLTNCTLSGNQSVSDSAGIACAGNVTLTNCTIANNTAGTLGGGLVVFSANVILVNTIVAQNTAATTSNINGTVNTGSSFNNLIGTNGTGGLTNGVNGNLVGVATPLLGTLGLYSGTTQNLPLLPGSPAINAGTSTGAPATDQRGIARPQQGTVDIGAFESMGFNTFGATGSGQSTPVSTAFAQPLTLTVFPANESEPVTGGRVTFTPPGAGASCSLATNPATINGVGQVSVTATANATVGGPYTVTAGANGIIGTTSYSLTNTAAATPPTITSANSTTFTIGTAGSFTVMTTGNPTPSLSSTGTLPSGVTFTDNGNGTATLGGTPAPGTNGTYPLTFTASNGALPNATQNFTLTVACPATVVTNGNDSGAGSLRQIITNACSGSTITFSGVSAVILTSATLTVDKTLTIQGGAGVTITRGSGSFGIFTVTGTGNLTLTNLTISNGNTGVGGGLAIPNGGTATVTNCLFTGNTATSSGAAVFNQTSLVATPATMSFTNCTFSGNIGTGASNAVFVNNAASNAMASITLTNCTVANNTGNGLLPSNGSGGTAAFFLKNTLLAGNSGQNGVTTFISGPPSGIFSQGNNLSSDGTCGGGAGDLLNTNPIIDSLRANSGPTQTCALLPGSPAINTGTGSGAPTTDQRGISRPQQGAVDIGAYETVGFTLFIFDGDQQSTPITTQFPTNLIVEVVSNNETDPVQGGQITFTAPGSGASCTFTGNPATIDSDNLAAVIATANGTAGGPYTVTASANGATSVNFGLTNTAAPTAPTITSANATTFTIGTAGSFTVMTTGNPTPSLSSTGVLPTGVTFTDNGNGTATLSGTPAIGTQGTYPLTFTATNGNSPDAIQNFTLTVACPTVTVTPPTLPGGTVGTAYNQTVSATPTGSYTFAVTAGSLPTGLTLTGATGVISGTPTVSGTFNFTVTATGFGTCTGSQAYTVVIACGSTVVTNLNDSGAGSLRQAILNANGCVGPDTITFTVTGTITLASSLPTVTDTLTITGPGATQLTVTGNNTFQIFIIQAATSVSGITVNGGFGANVSFGGAFQNFALLTLDACTLSNNTNGGGFGSGICALADVTVTNSTFTNNQGAILAHTGNITLTNTTISGVSSVGFNYFPDAGPVSLTLQNTTIAHGAGTSVFFDRRFNALTFTTRNSIFGSTGGNFGMTGAAGTLTVNSLGNNLSSDNTLTLGGPGDLMNMNPLLAALGSYGGPTQTRALLPGSPAINAGSATGAPTTDQRGIARVGNVDIGAFESRGFTMAVASGNNQSTIVSTAFTNPLAATVTANQVIEPVQGGQVTFTPPGAGASCTIAGNPATINAGGTATSGTATANGTAGGPYTVTASANGSTSASFSLTNTPANTPPTFTPAGALTRQQGSPAGAAVTVGTAADTETPAGSLTVTQIAGGTATGITVTGITNTNGTITAMVAASCTATPGTVRFQVTDSGSLTGTGDLTVTVTPNTAPTLTFTTPQNVTVGGSLTVNPATGPTDNGSVASIVLQSQGTYTGTISVNNTTGVVTISNAAPVGSHTITVRATDNCGATTDGTFTLNVGCQTITVTNPAVATGTAGATFSQTFTQTGGNGATTFAVASGTLPTGLTLSTAGVLSGTPTQTGTFPITVRATDSNNCQGTGATYNLVIGCQTITVTNPTTTTGTINTAFSQTFTQTGGIGTTTFALASGTLPTGLSLSTAGVLSGSPLQAGTFPITVRATDTNGCQGTGATYTLVISCQTITVTNPTVSTGTIGVAFSQTFTQTGGFGESITFALASGTLPTGLTLGTNGLLSGTPTQAGTFPITVRATDQNNCSGTGPTYNLVISCPAISISPTTLSPAMQGVAYSQLLTASPAATYNFSVPGGGLPIGISLTGGGTLSGTPTQAGTFTFTVQAMNVGNGCTGTQSYTLIVRARPTITAATGITRQQGSTGTVSTIATVSDAETAAGSLVVTATTVPAGLSVTGITNTNGTVTATVTASCTATVGANTVVLTVTDGDGLTATANLIVNVTANTAPVLGSYPAVTISTGNSGTVTPSAPPSDNGTVASVTVTASVGYTGTLTVNPATGVVTLTPFSGGTFLITVTATDNCGVSTVQTFTLATQPFIKAPFIDSITPNVGLIGSSVTITGFRLDQVKSVQFGGGEAVFTIDSPTQITAIVPRGGATGPVTASATTGVAIGPTFTIIRTK
ncbi:MAG: putative Ig domain-containing protein [Blastocatellia bacterium]|nr:putative Ig domain-containing protein [Blastocatellia bacterium]